jgi:uncharacterized OsmC-like protein
MATTTTHLSVTIGRDAAGKLTAANPRGGRLALGTGGDADFSPTELLLVAIGGCTGIDIDILTSRRSQPDQFEITVEADKVRAAEGNRLAGIEVTYRITFPDGEAGDAARAVLPAAVRQSHDRLCTVSRTVELGTPVTTRLA